MTDVTPWNVGGVVDYDKLVSTFGAKMIDEQTIARVERLTGRPAHHLLRRGIFFSHRDLDHILFRFQTHQPFYIYTGRGASSLSLHIGHIIPFTFCKYLQNVFDCPVVIQLTDDEKFLWKDMTLEQSQHLTRECMKDIIAFGFNPAKTFIFANTDYMGTMYPMVLRIQKCVNLNTAKAIFGFGGDDSIGKIAFPAVQAAPSFSGTFPALFNGASDIPCLIPCAIDQDAYFRMTRDVASKLGLPKPALIHAKFLPALQGLDSKMSSSGDDNTTIYMNDEQEIIKNKINKYAFSGGRKSVEEHRKHGGNPDVDISYQYLRFFLPDDEELKKIHDGYRSGAILSGDLKKRTITLLQSIVADFQAARALVTDEMITQFTTPKAIPLVFNEHIEDLKLPEWQRKVKWDRQIALILESQNRCRFN